MVFLCAPANHFFFLLPFLLYLAGRFAHGLWVMRRHPARRWSQAVGLGMWVAAVTVVGVAHEHHAAVAREDADRVLAVLLHQRWVHGAYPASLPEAGLSSGPSWRVRVSYALVQGEPLLTYRSTRNPFDWYVYDFAAKAWTVRPD